MVDNLQLGGSASEAERVSFCPNRSSATPLLECRVHHFTANIEGLTVHYVHEKSADPNAIPVILLHGWPGWFWLPKPS